MLAASDVLARAATVAVDVTRSDSCCCISLRAATVAVALDVALAVAVAVVFDVVPVDGDTSLVPKSEKEASAV